MATVTADSQPAASPRAIDVVGRLRARWAVVAGRLGMAFAAIGFAVILLAWNGAAGLDYTQGQIPYLISGGIGGLGLVVIGAALLITESHRRDRALLEQRLNEVVAALDRLALSAAAPGGTARAGSLTGAESVVAGRSSFHRADCHLVQGRAEAARMAQADAESAGLSPCRICHP